VYVYLLLLFLCIKVIPRGGEKLEHFGAMQKQTFLRFAEFCRTALCWEEAAAQLLLQSRQPPICSMWMREQHYSTVQIPHRLDQISSENQK
jgi:hypothetical protein